MALQRAMSEFGSTNISVGKIENIRKQFWDIINECNEVDESILHNTLKNSNFSL